MLKCYQEYYAFIGGYIENAVVCKESGSNANIGKLFIGCNVKINYSIFGVEKLLFVINRQAFSGAPMYMYMYIGAMCTCILLQPLFSYLFS